MSEYIDRKAVVPAIDERFELSKTGWFLVDGAIANIPTADVVPVVHARWIHSRYDDCSEKFEIVKCSQCNYEAYNTAIYVRCGNYCPNCGAKMEVKNNV